MAPYCVYRKIRCITLKFPGNFKNNRNKSSILNCLLGTRPDGIKVAVCQLKKILLLYPWMKNYPLTDSWQFCVLFAYQTEVVKLDRLIADPLRLSGEMSSVILVSQKKEFTNVNLTLNIWLVFEFHQWLAVLLLWSSGFNRMRCWFANQLFWFAYPFPVCIWGITKKPEVIYFADTFDGTQWTINGWYPSWGFAKFRSVFNGW